MQIRLLQRLVFVGLFLIWAGLFKAQVIEGAAYRVKSEKNRTRLVHLPAARGPILDRNGVPLAKDEVSFELAVLPQEMRDPPRTWERLGQMVGLPAEDLARRYKRGYQARFSPVALVRDLSPELAFQLEEERNLLPGIIVRPIPRRRYPLGPAVGAVTGYLGLIAPEELTRLKPYGYSFRDRVGKDGLEQVYDSSLRGTDGGLHVEVNAQGRLVQQMGYRPPRRGKKLTVSIDSRLQKICHDLLRGGRGSVVVMESASGEVLALASEPSFDPNAFVDSTRHSEVRGFLQDPDRPMFNRATRARVPPGSIFKAAVAYEALKTGKILSGTAFTCPGRFQLGGSTFRCWEAAGHGAQTVPEALQHSCNVFFYQTGRRLGAAGIGKAAERFLLNEPTGIDLPREVSGLVPGPEWMVKAHRQRWQEGDTVSFAIGQSALSVTPLEMLRMFNTIAMDGKSPRPHLLLRVEEEKPADLLRAEAPQVALDSQALAAVKDGLERVVGTETGTGRLARIPGVSVAGKTGTAQVPNGFPHAWFCGYAPAKAPKLSFVVFLENGGKGGLQAAQVAGQLLAYLKEMEYL
ncbi:MAG: penicillin-binding protein 2 [Candidatus Omnitrophica bacterium]|nr:penicillin-binding protein 2 [Candidatus Omnitrophota bacterium]